MLLTCGLCGLYSQQRPPNEINRQHARLLKNRNDGEALQSISFILLNKADYDQSILYARQLNDLGEQQNNDSYRMYASICLGQALTMKSISDSSKYHLDRAMILAQKLKNYNALCSVYNGLGLYAINIDLNHYQALNYFFEGIEVAKQCGNERLYSIMLCNLCGIYFLKGDTEGLKYSLECYERGHARSDAYLVFCGASNASYMYYILGRYEQALKYAREAEFMMIRHEFHDHSNVYSLFGNILMMLDNDADSESYFKKSIESADNSESASLIHTYLGYGRLMTKKGRYYEAVKMFETGISLSREKSRGIWLSELYKNLSVTYELSGNNGNALKYQKIFQSHSDSLFNVDKEHSMNELRIKYDTEKHISDLRQNQLTLLRHEQKLYLMLSALIVAILAIGGVLFQYRRKNRQYRQIVIQNQDAIRREKMLEQQIANLRSDETRYSGSSLSDEKSRELYERLDKLMRTEHIYCEKELTKDKISEMLGTNRTYLSQVINEQTGMSFTHYINSLRIDHAVRTLSDPTSNVPIKALAADLGFSSITTFYTLFKSSVGMTPSRYWDKVLELESEKRRIL